MATEYNEIRVVIDNNVNITQDGKNITPGLSSPIGSIRQSVQPSRQFGIGGALSAQFLVEQSTRLLGAVGNQELAQTISTTSRYTFLGARALGGDATAIATLAVRLATQAIEEVRKQAEIQNETDNARIKAGLINMEGVRIRKGIISGRQYYNRG